MFGVGREPKRSIRRVLLLLAVSSAFVFVAQMINFPITYGTSRHLVDGTFLSVVLGPYAAVLSITIVLLVQALFFADGGLLALGCQPLNMIITGLGFFIVKLIAGKSVGASVPPWKFCSFMVLGYVRALTCGLEI